MFFNVETNPDGSVKAISIELVQRGESSRIRFEDEKALSLINFCKGIETEKAEKVVSKKTNTEFIFDLIVANGSAKYGRILSELVKDGRSVSRDSLHTTLNKMIREGRLTIVGEKFPADERTYAIQKVEPRNRSLQSNVYETMKKSGRRMTTKEISDSLGMDTTTYVKNALGHLKNKGLVSKVGNDGYFGVWEVVA